jgi:Phage integrase family
MAEAHSEARRIGEAIRQARVLQRRSQSVWSGAQADPVSDLRHGCARGRTGKIPPLTSSFVQRWAIIWEVFGPRRWRAGGSFVVRARRGVRPWGHLQAAPEDGMHALRHAYASVLLDAGESIKALSEYLGHSDPGFTLRTYTHLLPSSETRTRKAIDDAFTEAEAEGNGDPPAAQGTSVPRTKSMCPGRLTAPPRHQKGRGPKTPPDPQETPGQGQTRQYG